MSTPGSHHVHGGSIWGASSHSSPVLGTSLGDSFGQARTHYQSGYMMQTGAQNNVLQQSTQRVDDIPIVQTKAKMNNGFTRGTASFGMDSMFETGSRQRQTFTDEDAPPTTTVHDMFVDGQFENSALQTSYVTRQPEPSAGSTPTQIHYVIVFGYPPDKYTTTVEYFKSIGETTEPMPNSEIMNCFRIGYKDLSEALRAVRRNGEIICGSWMVGVKWADPAQAEALLGRSLGRPTLTTSPVHELNSPQTPPNHSPRENPTTPAVGTPMRLAPSTAAFRKPGYQTSSPLRKALDVSGPTSTVTTLLSSNSMPAEPSSKGIVGQMSDLIFGW